MTLSFLLLFLPALLALFLAWKKSFRQLCLWVIAAQGLGLAVRFVGLLIWLGLQWCDPNALSWSYLTAYYSGQQLMSALAIGGCVVYVVILLLCAWSIRNKPPEGQDPSVAS